MTYQSNRISWSSPHSSLTEMGPKFLSCSWCTRFQHTTKVSHPHLDSEKGATHAPILLRFFNYLDQQCNLVDMIHQWHDPSGLCRASDEESSSLILLFDRHVDGQNRKCQQKIILPSTQLFFPVFADATGAISYVPFRIAALTYHMGIGPNSGHHRTALRYRGTWMIYDDNRLPEVTHTLSDAILCNLTTLWLVKPTHHAVRTMDQDPLHASSSLRTSASRAAGLSAGTSAPEASEAAEGSRSTERTSVDAAPEDSEPPTKRTRTIEE